MAAIDESKPVTQKRRATRSKELSWTSASVILLVTLAGLFFLSFSVGQYPVPPLDVVKVLASHIFPITPTWPSTFDTVVVQIRLPRILAAVLVGASLAVAGTSFQGLFRNPLVSPDILGVSSGASFGAALGILFSGNALVIEGSAFGFGLLAVGISYGISKIVRGDPTLSLILAGMAIGSLFSAFLALVKYVADPIDQLPAITYWLMGSLASVKNSDLGLVSIPMLLGIAVLMLIRWRLNVLAMGEEEAMALGVDTSRLRAAIVICCTMITASAVCISGIIGWVGLIIPHIGRALVGPSHEKLLPASTLLGAAYLLLIDDLCRTVAAVEIPIGTLTAIVGVPFFLYLLIKGRNGWA
jgi:iron complex transport system permease protein